MSSTHRILSQEYDGKIVYKVQYKKRIPFLLPHYWKDYCWSIDKNIARLFDTLDSAKAFMYDRKRIEEELEEKQLEQKIKNRLPWKRVKEEDYEF